MKTYIVVDISPTIAGHDKVILCLVTAHTSILTPLIQVFLNKSACEAFLCYLQFFINQYFWKPSI